MHAVPDAPFTAAFGQYRAVSWLALVSFRGARYSVPDRLVGAQVWVRDAGDDIVIVAGEGTGATEVARHRRLPAGQTSICDDHYPNHQNRDPLHRTPRATNPAEAAFLALGEGAKLYLVEAGAAGIRRVEARMAEAVALSALHGRHAVDRALGTAAMSAASPRATSGRSSCTPPGRCPGRPRHPRSTPWLPAPAGGRP